MKLHLLFLGPVLCAFPVFADPIHAAAESGNTNQILELVKTDPTLIDAPDATGATPLIAAAIGGQPAAVTLLLDLGADIAQGDKFGATPLHFASSDFDFRAFQDFLQTQLRMGNPPTKEWTVSFGFQVIGRQQRERRLECLRILLHEQAPINRPDLSRMAPLHLASLNRTPDALNFLLAHQPKLELENAHRLTPLHQAVLRTNLAATKVLLDAGALVNMAGAPHELRTQPLHSAVGSGDAALVQLLLHAGARTDLLDSHGWTALHYAARAGRIPLAELLLRAKAGIDQRDSAGYTPLVTAAETNAVKMAQWLLRKGAQVNLTTTNNATALMLAVAHASLNLTRSLLDHKASLSTPPGSIGYLQLAAATGNPKLVRLLLDAGADPNSREGSGSTPLHLAWPNQELLRKDLIFSSGSDKDYLEIAKVLLACQADPNLKDHLGNTPLHVFASQGNLPMVRLLLQHRADARALNSFGSTPLLMAAGNSGSAEIIQLLATAGASPNQTNFLAVLPLQVAILTNNLSAASGLLKAGADPNARDTNGATALHWAALRGSVALLDLLAKHGADPNARDIINQVPLHLAAGSNSLPVLKQLIQLSSNVNALAINGATPLHLAVARQDPEFTAVLLRAGADPNLQIREIGAALHTAAYAGAVATAKLLLAHGAHVAATNQSGATPLHLAAKAGRKEMAEFFITQGASLHVADKFGFTPLHEAADRGNAETVEALLKHGAQIEARDNYGSTPLHLASQAEFNTPGAYRKTAEVLLAHNASVHVRMTEGQTPLHRAAFKGHFEVAATLLQNHADPNSADDKQRTPLHFAAYHGHRAVSQLLVLEGANPNAKTARGETPLLFASAQFHAPLAEFLREHGATISGAGIEQNVVADLGDLGRIDFAGHETFTTDELRSALRRNLEFLIAADPLAPRSGFITLLPRLIQRGYAAAGFPDAQIAFEVSADGQNGVIRIAEGPRYFNGPIVVEGAKTVPVNELIQLLTDPTRTAQARTSKRPEQPAPTQTLHVGSFEPAASNMGYLDSTGKEVKEMDPLWLQGWPAHFSDGPTILAARRLQEMRQYVIQQLHGLGYLFPKAEAELRRVDPDRRLDFIVRILDEGPYGPIADLRVVGNAKNSREEILTYLGLQPGMSLAPGFIRALEQKLWNSARFLSYRVIPESITTNDASATRLTLELRELPQAPPLSAEFSPEQRAALQFREWLMRDAFESEDMIVDVSIRQSAYPLPPRFRFILSSAGLAFLTGPDEAGSDAAQTRDRFFLENGTMAFARASSGDKFILPLSKRQISGASLTLLPAEPDSETREHLELGWFTHGAPASRPQDSIRAFQLHVLVAPALALLRVEQTNGSLSWEGASLRLSRTNWTAVIDSRSGRLETAAFIEQAPAYTLDGRISFRPGALREARAALDSQAATNRYDPQRPFTSFAAYSVRALVDSEFLATRLWPDVAPAQRNSAGAAVVELINKGILSPLDQYVVSRRDAGTNRFSIPTEQEEITSFPAMIAAFVFEGCDRIFPRGSWPWLVSREAVFVLANKTENTGQVLQRLYESNEMGPIGFLVVARLLNHLGSPAALMFAERGLERLTFDHFRKDWATLAESSALSGRVSAVRLQAAQLSPGELSALLAICPTNLVALFSAALSASAAVENSGPRDSLAAPLWNAFAKDQLAAALAAAAASSREITEKRAPVRAALSHYEKKNYAEAIRLFKQAAETGNADAFFYLGYCYEQGSGVGRDLNQAMSSYREAAQRGHLEAQVRLADLCLNPSSGSPDRLEAFVWLTLAADQGHYVARAQKRVLAESLTTEQINAAQQRVEQIKPKK